MFLDPILTARQLWRQSQFGSIANSGEGADDNDPDHDGVCNLLEYAFQTNPKSADAQPIPQWQQSGGDYVMSFTQDDAVGGIVYGAESSTTLAAGSWSAIPDSGNGRLHIFRVTPGTPGKLFLRLKVTAP